MIEIDENKKRVVIQNDGQVVIYNDNARIDAHGPQPPLEVDEEPTLKILDSFITHSPKRYIEEAILDGFRDNIKKKDDYE